MDTDDRRQLPVDAEIQVGIRGGQRVIFLLFSLRDMAALVLKDKAVSYTHLDVYKRQIQVRLDKVYDSKFYTFTSVDKYCGATAIGCPHFVGVKEGKMCIRDSSSTPFSAVSKLSCKKLAIKSEIPMGTSPFSSLSFDFDHL